MPSGSFRSLDFWFIGAGSEITDGSIIGLGALNS
jgi:hypothetical protein